MRELLLYASLPVLAIFILRNPFVGLMCYIGVNIIRPEMLFWGGRQGTIVFMSFIGATAVSLLNHSSAPFKQLSSRELLLFLWIWFAIIVSLLLSPYPANPRAYPFANEVLKMLVLGWLMLTILDSPHRVQRCYEGMVFLYSLLALWGIDQHFRGNERLEGLMASTFDSNGIASLFVLAFPMALGIAFSAPGKITRRLGWGASLTLVLGIVATQSRGGFLGLCVCVFLFFLRSKRKKAILLGLCLLCIPATFFVTDDYRSRLGTMTAEEEERDFSAAGRLVLWKAGILVFKDNPLFGTGFLSFPVAKLGYRDAVEDVDEPLREYAFQGFKVGHNTYVQLLSEGGLFLFTPYMLLIVQTIWSNRRTRIMTRNNESFLLQYMNCVEVGLIGMCFCNIFIDAVTSVFIPLQIFLARAMRNVRNAEAASDENMNLAPVLGVNDGQTVSGKIAQ